MTLNTFTALATFVLILSASLINSRKIVRREVNPTLSTWVIVMTAAILSFITYLSAENRDVIAGVLNAGDVASTLIITVTIIFFGKTGWHLKSFEKFYFCGLLIIGIFWFLTSSSFYSNLLLQLLISLGYIPTVHHMVKTQTNNESFLVWGLILSASVVSLYPTINAWINTGNVLALTYSVRSIVFLGGTMLLMVKYTPSSSR